MMEKGVEERLMLEGAVMGWMSTWRTGAPAVGAETAAAGGGFKRGKGKEEQRWKETACTMSFGELGFRGNTFYNKREHIL